MSAIEIPPSPLIPTKKPITPRSFPSYTHETPTKSKSLGSPASIRSDSSLTATLVDLGETATPQEKASKQKLVTAFQLHDYLVKEGHEDFPFPFFATIGQQSSAKSSVLSALLKIPLYSEQGQATHGPTLIHSRFSRGQFHANIDIELAKPSPDSTKRVEFTSKKITDLAILRKALRLAGEEARRIGRISSAARTFEDIIDNEEGEQSATEAVSGFTENIVRLFIHGPEQLDISVVDLPGLNGNEFVNGLVDTYLSRPECTAILCHAAGGSDPNPQNKDFEILLAARPDGRGVLGVITKADRIDVSNSSPEIKLIKGMRVHTFVPEHGWWPLRLRTGEERDLSREEYLARQSHLFRTDSWKKAFSEEERKHFGVEATEELLMTINHRKVLANHDNLLQTFHRLESQVLKAVSRLATAKDAIAETHDIILRISEILESALTDTAEHSDALYRLQKQFGGDLSKAVTDLLPYAKKDAARASSYKYPELGGSKPHENRPKLYLESILTPVKSRAIKRTGACDPKKLRMEIIGPHVLAWKEKSLQHVEKVWTKVAKITETIVEAECRGKPELAVAINNILRDDHAVLQKRVKEDIERDFEIDIRHDPKFIDVWEGSQKTRHATALQHFRDNYSQIYSATTPQGQQPLAPPESTELERQNAFQLMADIAIALEYGAGRWHTNIGRRTQAAVLIYLEGITVSLRQGLELESMQDVPAKRVRDLCEPDIEARRERDELLKKARRLEMIQRRIGLE